MKRPSRRNFNLFIKTDSNPAEVTLKTHSGMKLNLRRNAIVALALLISSVSFVSYSKGWEVLKSEKAQTQRVASNTEVDIRATRGYIYITTTRQVNIKIFTILGSRISEDALAPGSYQFPVPAHGVYIVKAGDLTCKVAV